MTGSSPAVDTTAIAQGLSNPLGVFAENGCTATVRPPRLVLAVRTDTAFALPLAAIFIEALRTRLPLEPATADAIELSLHEALANAIIHGNLHLSSEGRDSPHVYGNFCAELAARLQDPVAAARMVHVAARWTKTRLSLAVTDQGRGFILPNPMQSTEATHGRGLSIVRAFAVSVTWNQRRRRLMFVFDIKGGDRAMSVPDVPRSISATLLSCGILLIAGTENQSVIGGGLRRAGFRRLLFASNADQALHIASNENLDLVLLDLPIHAFDGVRLCAALRQTCRQADLPILAMIAVQDNDEQMLILGAGAADVLVKPLPERNLIARTMLQLEQRLLVRDLQAFHHRTATELATARDMQRALLPDEATLREIKERYNIGIAATFKPSTELGGDLWGAWSIDATRMGVFMCDVSGHGTIAAINTFRLHTIMARNDFDKSDPGRFMTSLNDRLTGLLVSGQYVTMLYAVFDTRQDCMTYAAAGSPEPLLALPACALEGLDGSGLPLGIAAGVTYPTQRAPFGPGARLMLLSDALAEARLSDGTYLGDHEARAMVTAVLAHETPAEIVSTLTRHINERAGEQLEDDLTLICIERPAPARDPGRPVMLSDPPATAGRLLVVDNVSQRRQLVQRIAAALALAVDAAPDFTCASRFLAECRYDVVVVDVNAAEEALEFFYTIASTNLRAHLVLIGVHSDASRLLAISLGLTIAATLNSTTDGAALHDVLSAILANGDATLVKSAPQTMTEADLIQALAGGEIAFGFQPLISLTTGRLVGAEALARWTSPKYGAVPSNVFLSLVENDRAATLLTDVTLRIALAACASWRRLVPAVGVAVNFSAESLAQSDLASLVSMRLREANLASDALTVDVAETDAARCIPMLTALRETGVGIGLDGFGHGETSLRLLGQLPIGIVKIDRSVIQHCVAEPDAVRLLRAITGAARAFNLTVAAVGVEVHAAEQMLREAGCDIAQGWLYGPAMPANQISRLLSLA